MKRTKTLANALHDDWRLLALFAGIILCGISIIGMAITAGILYL
jgi:hypothetical protein